MPLGSSRADASHARHLTHNRWRPGVDNIRVGNRPFWVAVSPDGSLAYVTNLNLNAGTVSVINTATNTVIDTIPVGTQPFGVAVSPDGMPARRGDRLARVSSMLLKQSRRAPAPKVLAHRHSSQPWDREL
jgi:YVTN family beta-propeller protein